jgi:hypothetical protein
VNFTKISAAMKATTMTAEDLIELLEERPFLPLQLRLDDGRSYEIRHPAMAIVTPSIVAIGLSRGNGSRLAERVTHCSIAHIVEFGPVEKSRS